MSQLDDRAIEMMAKNMEYIRLGLNNNKGNEDTARWLFYLIKSYMEDVDAHSRADAIEARNHLNSGYTKAGH